MATSHFTLPVIILSVSMLCAAQVYASQPNVGNLFRGNTAFGTQVKWGLSISVLFASDGQIVVVDERGKTERGVWWVSNNGELCTKFRIERCRKVTRHPEGFYQVHNDDNDRLVDWKLAEIKRGNPYKIE